MIISQCPAQERLTAYGLGKLNESEMQEVDQHIQHCHSCAEHVDGRHEDSLLNLLDGADTSDESMADDAYQLAATDLKRRLRGESAKLPMNGVLGPYTLIEPVGCGGMGRVYRAVHRKLNKTVAIKFLPEKHGISPLAIARFEREVRAAGALEHPAIVQATDAGEIDGVPFLVMQFIDGLDLSALLRVCGPLPPPEACELVRQAAVALAYAHQHGIIHRDVKPSNLMLTKDGTVKVLDLGLARISNSFQPSSSLTGTGQLLGTLDYMSPEQAHGESVDARTDVYALGATLYKLLTGRNVGDDGESTSALARLQHRSSLDGVDFRDMPTALVAALRSMLQPDPSQRLAAAADVTSTLASLSSDADLATLHDRARRLAAEKQQMFQASPTFGGEASVTTRPEHRVGIAAAQVNQSGGWKLWTIVAVAAAAGWIGLLTIIVLQSKRGQIVIESDVPGVKINVLRDGEIYDEFTIQSDPRSLKLYVDRYEIQLPEAGGELSVEPNTIELKQGKTTVVRVTRGKPMPDSATVFDAPTRAQVTAAFSRPANPSLAEPMYQGQTLSTWLRTIQFERDPELVKNALDKALPHLANRSTSERIEQALLGRLRDEDYESHSYFKLIDSGSSVDDFCLQWLTKADGMTSSPRLVNDLSSQNPNAQQTALRVAALARLNTLARYSGEVEAAIVKLHDSDISEIRFAALLATLASPYPLSSKNQDLAQQLLSDSDPYVAYLGAKVVSHASLDRWLPTAHEKMLPIIAGHADRRLVTEATALLQSQPTAKVTEAAADAVLTLQNRSDLNVEFVLLQDRILGAIEQHGKPSDEAVTKLNQLLKARYEKAPTFSEAPGGIAGINQPGLAAMDMGDEYNEFDSGEGEGFGSMDMMEEGYDAGGYGEMNAAGMPGGGEDMMDTGVPTLSPHRRFAFQGQVYTRPYLRRTDGTPRKVIDAIFALTDDPNSWAEPVDKPYAAAVRRWLTSNKTAQPVIGHFARFYFPRAIYPKLVMEDIQQHKVAFGDTIAALGPLSIPRVAHGGPGMMDAMFADAETMMEDAAAGDGNEPPREFRSQYELPTVAHERSAFYSRLLQDMMKDTQQSWQSRAWIERVWRHSLPPRFGVSRDAWDDFARGALSSQDLMDRAVALRIATVLATPQQANHLLQSLSDVMESDRYDDVMLPMTADGVIYLIGKHSRHRDFKKDAANKQAQQLIDTLIGSEDAKHRLFGLFLSIQGGLTLSVEQYHSVLTTSIPKELTVGKGPSSDTWLLTQGVEVNSYWFSNKCRDMYLRVMDKQKHDSIEKLQSDQSASRRLVDYLD